MHFIVTLVIINIIGAIIIRVYNKLTTGICKCSRHLVGKVVIITGGNSGIGYETAKDLAARGARVILADKHVAEGNAARDSIVAATGNNNVNFQELNLASLASVKAFANNIIRTEKRVDILINNASFGEEDNIKTEDGLSLHMQVNYFGHFLLTALLLPLLKSSSPSRIINMSSDSHRRGYIDFDNLNDEKETKKSYNHYQVNRRSKLCNILMTLELARRLEGTKVTSNCVNPGYVASNITTEVAPIVRYFTSILNWFFKTPWEGAQTTIFLSVAPEVENVSGKYYSDCREKRPAPQVQDIGVAHKLWEVSEKLVGLKSHSTDYKLFLFSSNTFLRSNSRD